MNNQLDLARIQQVLNQYGETIVNEYRRLLYVNRNNATGELGNTIRYFTTSDNQTYELSIGLAEQWKYLEYGRRAGAKQPPIQAIKDWIKIKPVLPNTKSGKLPTTDELAYLIARSISKNGIPAKHYLGNIVQQLDQTILENAIDKDVRNKVDLIFNNF